MNIVSHVEHSIGQLRMPWSHCIWPFAVLSKGNLSQLGKELDTTDNRGPTSRQRSISLIWFLPSQDSSSHPLLHLADKMSKVEPSLNILLPTYNNEFPAELLDLANALLAQTQSRAAALKPDEQIAMPYACAEIACKR